MLHRPDAEYLYLARVVEGGDTYFIPDPDVLVYTGPEGWIPVEILFSAAEWQQFLHTQSGNTGDQKQDGPNAYMIDFANIWVQRLLEEGWLAYGKKVDRSIGRMAGCQSDNHKKCYGELWQCAACNKTVCYAEGTDNHPELCDDCWAKLYESTLMLACDCSEEECGTWLELTPNGILALEDKDGLRVSIMLPEWLDGVIRNASRAQQGMVSTPEKGDLKQIWLSEGKYSWQVKYAVKPLTHFNS
jgi:hypothetical protein